MKMKDIPNKMLGLKAIMDKYQENMKAMDIVLGFLEMKVLEMEEEHDKVEKEYCELHKKWQQVKNTTAPGGKPVCKQTREEE